MAKQSRYTGEKSKESHSTNSSKNCRIICTPTFLREAKQLAKKYPNIKKDYLELKNQLKQNPEQGDDLGYGLRKIRMIISDKRQGKSGSARVIIQVKIVDACIYVLSTYDKAEYDTLITDLLKKQLKQEEEKRQQLEKRNEGRK